MSQLSGSRLGSSESRVVAMRAAISQQIQDWTQQWRDKLEYLNDEIAHFHGSINNQLVAVQQRAEQARLSAEEAERQARAADEWEFLGIRGRDGGIEFGSTFAIEWAGYADRSGAALGGALFLGGDFITLGKYYTDQDRASMYEYYASQGLENYYLAGGAISQHTILGVTAIVTGGVAGGAAGSMGASGGFVGFVDVLIGSASASAAHQQYSTGEVRSDLLAGHTLIGLGTAGALYGVVRGFSAAHNLRLGSSTRSSKGNATQDLMIGRKGGKVASRDYLRKLDAHLARRGVDFKVGGKGVFRVPVSGRPLLRVPRNPTMYEVWHELMHFRQYQHMGRGAYMAQARGPGNAPEQFVYNALRNGRHWDLLNPAEQNHAQNYIYSWGGYTLPLCR